MLITVNAQNIGIKAGFSAAEGMYSLYVTKMPSSFIVGLPAGININIPVSESIFLNTGLLFIKKGTEAYLPAVEKKIRVRYLEIPVNVGYKYDFGTWKLFAQAGPYTGIGISARIKQEDDKKKVEFGSGTDQFKRMDYGINIGCGTEINQIQVGINYGFGFINISHIQSEKIRNRVFTVAVVYSLEALFSKIRY